MPVKNEKSNLIQSQYARIEKNLYFSIYLIISCKKTNIKRHDAGYMTVINFVAKK